MATMIHEDGRKTVAIDCYLNKLEGSRMVSCVQDPNPASLVSYLPGDRAWAMHEHDASLMSLVEVSSVGPKRVTVTKGVYDEDEAESLGLEESTGGYAAGDVQTHEHEYGVRVIHTEPTPNYEAMHPGMSRIYPSMEESHASNRPKLQ